MTQGSWGPLWHKKDPEPSRGAAMSHAELAESNQNLVVDLVRQFPGRTAGELSLKCNLGLIEVRRRLSDAKNRGRVINDARRVCEVLKNPATVWRILEA